MLEFESQSYYEVLDIKPDATQNEIRQAYLRAKSAYGKDSAALYSLFDDQQTKEFLDNIEQAYLILSSPEKRKEYDRVHGFLSTANGFPEAQKSSNSFSFARAKATHSKTVDSSKTLMTSTSFETPYATELAAPQQVMQAPPSDQQTSEEDNLLKKLPDESRPSFEHIEDFSTPRTLTGAGQSLGHPVQDYKTPTFNGAERSAHSLIRRSELYREHTVKPDFEQKINAETEFKGPFLKEVREYKNITLDELCDYTKISKSYLSAIEEEDFAKLPAFPYLRGFIVQVAKALKLPHEKVAQAYMAHYKKCTQK
jgi:curved DNA-binding protein CbpA